MARNHSAAEAAAAATGASRPASCGEGSGSRSSRSSRSGTWLMAAALGLALLAAGATASDPMMGGPSPTTQPAYSRFREFSYNMRMRLDAVSSRLQGKDTQIYSEMNNLPPKPLEVFQYGPSRPAWMRNPKKYRYQYVCVVATTGSVEEGIWHRRRSPIKWKYEPPFYVRIVRPNPAGMLDHLLTAKKIRLANKEVTIRKTDNTTGRYKETTRPMVVVERIDADEMPEHIAEMIQAQEEGRAWVDTRENKGRWGPSNLEEDHEEGVMELLGEAGIETQEEIDDITKVINKKTGEKFDLKRAFDFGDTRRGYSRWTQAMAKKAKQRRRAEQKREKELQRQQKKQQQ